METVLDIQCEGSLIQATRGGVFSPPPNREGNKMTDRVKRPRDLKYAHDEFYGGFRLHNQPGVGCDRGGVKVILCPNKRLINFRTIEEAKAYIDKFRQGFFSEDNDQGRSYRRIDL